MDMNQLLYNHQLAQLQASEAACGEERAEKAMLVGHHAEQIANWRHANNLPQTGWPLDERPAMQVPE